MGRGRLSFGLLVIVVGVLLLMRNSGFVALDIGTIFRTYWPVLLIILGLNAFPDRRSGSWTGGTILVAVGLLFLGRNLAWWSFEAALFWKLFWPALLILIGLQLLFRRPWEERRHEYEQPGPEPEYPRDQPAADRTYRNDSGPSGATIHHHEAVLSELRLELRPEQLAPGENVYRLNAVLGEIKLSVPADLPVVATGNAVLGGLQFFSRSSGGVVVELRAEQAGPDDSGTAAGLQRLRIEANAVLGSITVKAINDR